MKASWSLNGNRVSHASGFPVRSAQRGACAGIGTLEGLETVANFSYFRSVIVRSVFNMQGDGGGEKLFFFHSKHSSNIHSKQL